jgi:cellulose synthase/poly-beta-1,6-N-acetylglucosamine synthase-like glycosyltransferase
MIPAELQLDATLHRVSPRYSPSPMRWPGRLIHGAVFTAWLAVLVGAFGATGLLTWSAGLLYVTYDTILLLTVYFKTRFILGGLPAIPSSALSAATTWPRLAVIVAARNEAEALPRTLDALLAQNDPPETILVVDDGSVDASAAVLAARYGLEAEVDGALQRSTLQPQLALLRRSPGGKARALNAAIARLDEDLILTVDADTLLEPGAIGAVRTAFAREPQLVSICGVLRPVCLPVPGSRFFEWFQTYEYIRAFISRIAWMRSSSLLLVSGAFAGFRRAPLVTVGGFDADCLVEDYELIHRLHRWSHDHGLGWTVRVLGTARGVTEAPGTLPSFLRQRRRWFAGFLQTQWWNRDMTGNARYGSLGTLMMPIKAVDTLQPVYGLTAFCLLVWFIVAGRPVFWPVLAVIIVKILIDLSFHLWSVRLYSHWIGERTTASRIGMAALAALAEPFSFQLMRHTGATWGWISFLRGKYVWGAQSGIAIKSQKESTT